MCSVVYRAQRTKNLGNLEAKRADGCLNLDYGETTRVLGNKSTRADWQMDAREGIRAWACGGCADTIRETIDYRRAEQR